MIEHHREVCAFLAGIGATAVRIEQRGRHPHVVFRWQGRERRSALASSPGDFHATRAQIKNLRHMLGLVGGKRIGERRARRRPRAIPVYAAPPPSTRFIATRDLPPLNTPFAGLAQLLEARAAA